MRARSFWACLLLPAFAVAAPAPETYTIKLKHNPSPGKSVTVKDTSKQTGSVKIFDPDGKLLMENKPDEAKEEIYTQKVLIQEKGDKRPQKYTKTFKKAVAIGNGTEKQLSYHGCTIVFELKDGKYQVAVEGDKAVTKKDLDALAKQANDQDAKTMDELLLPKTAVKLKEPWKLDVKNLAKLFGAGAKVDVEKSKAEAQLLKAYKKDGKQFGVIELSIKLAIKGLPGGIEFDPPATMDMKMTLDASIDGSDTSGSLTMTGKLKGKAGIDQNGMKFSIEMNMDTSGKQEQSSEK
jgi:hypothetical protein